jgi:hypothetical protein
VDLGETKMIRDLLPQCLLEVNADGEGEYASLLVGQCQIPYKYITYTATCSSLIGRVFILARCQVPIGIFARTTPYIGRVVVAVVSW